MSEPSKEDLFDRLFKRADDMFARVDKMFDNFPWTEPVHNEGFFSTVHTTTRDTTFKGEEDPNPKMEYLVKDVFTLNHIEGLEGSLNSLGEEGWDLIHYDGDKAIFSRIAE